MMSAITDAGRQAIADLAARYGLSQEAVEQMARAVANGGGTMAQFNIPELGGNGQWMSGGMTMVGDMFNYGLQSTVSNLCVELSNAMANAPFFLAAKPTAWWPQELGQPAAVGGQNQMRYAYFPQERRLAIDTGAGETVLLDTGEHQIGGFSQQQSGYGDPFVGLTFSSQFGQFAVSSLPRVGPGQEWAPAPAQHAPPPPEPAAPEMAPPEPIAPFSPDSVAPDVPPPTPAAQGGGDAAAILQTIERLAALRDSGALTEDEFSAKKSDLLARL